MTTISASTTHTPATQLCKRLCIFFLLSALPIPALAQTFTSLAEFDQTNGANPYGTLAQGIDGNFYGTTEFGGTNGYGSIYKLTPEGTLTTLYSFCSVSGCTDGGQPFAGLTLGFDQNFYGATNNTIFRVTTAGQLTTLYTFCSEPNCADGSALYGTLVQAAGGDFYGTTSSGGIRTVQCEAGCGTIFKITPSGTLTTIYSFHGKDGYGPIAGLTLATDGNLYGVASDGGAYGYGSIFRISASGAFTLLHSFHLTDGGQPDAPLLQASDGNFYGTAITGGKGDGDGTVFKITPSGQFTLLRTFNYANGASPYGGLVQAADGNFFGTTYTGGSGTSCPIGTCGTIFRITPTGRLTTLYNFCSQSGCADGGGPFAALTLGPDNALYGTTTLGGSTGCGADGSCGTVFKLSLPLPPETRGHTGVAPLLTQRTRSLDSPRFRP